jgi:hypothetical protein
VVLRWTDDRERERRREQKEIYSSSSSTEREDRRGRWGRWWEELEARATVGEKSEGEERWSGQAARPSPGVQDWPTVAGGG